MIVTKKLNVHENDFFDFLETSLKHDIKLSTGKTVKEINTGYVYEKQLANKLKQQGNVKVTIEKFDRPFQYIGKVYSNQGFNYMTYTVEKIDDENINVSYEEEFLSDRKLMNLNYKFVSNIYKKRTLRRMEAMLLNIELNIINAKKETVLCQD